MGIEIAIRVNDLDMEFCRFIHWWCSFSFYRIMFSTMVPSLCREAMKT